MYNLCCLITFLSKCYPLFGYRKFLFLPLKQRRRLQTLGFFELLEKCANLGLAFEAELALANRSFLRRFVGLNLLLCLVHIMNGTKK